MASDSLCLMATLSNPGTVFERYVLSLIVAIRTAVNCVQR